MTLLAPLALAALLVPAAIYLVHWFFGSRRRLRVPAVFLWADLPRASTGRSRRRWPPLTLLLLLQLLTAVLAVLALARPAMPSEPPRHVALILDASASMQATDVAPTRFEAARARGMDRLAALRPSSDLVSFIRAGREASLLASGAPDNVRAALAAAQPGTGGAAIREALALASSQVAATPERRGQIVLLTDAAWPAPEPVGPLAAAVEVVAVGGGSDNQAVTDLSVRMDPTGRGQTAFVELANQADHTARIPMRLTADGAPLDERQVDVAARTRTRLSIPLPVEARHVTVRLLGRDSLALDDVVETTAPGGPPRDVLVLGRASDSLRRALESIPSLHMRPATTVPAEGRQNQPDLTVLAGVLPTQLPPGPLLLVDPPSTSPRLLGVGLGNGARVQETHPLLQGLDLVALQGETPSVGGVPGWADVVLGTVQGPLITEGKLEGRPVVALTFDARMSGLEKSLAFPLLISNATAYLLLQADTAKGFAATAEAFDRAESDIAPRAIPTFPSASSLVPAAGDPEGRGGAVRTAAGDSPVLGAASPNGGGEGLAGSNFVDERWQWLMGAAIVVLGAEWLVFARRG